MPDWAEIHLLRPGRDHFEIVGTTHTALVLTLEHGVHQLTVRREGFVTTTFTLNVDASMHNTPQTFLLQREDQVVFP
jgi:hypothetical protein